MAQAHPPYDSPKPFYLVSKNIGLQAVTAASDQYVMGKDNLVKEIRYINESTMKRQQFRLDPSQLDKNEFFVKLHATSLVLEAPGKEGEPPFLNSQGSVDINGGIQVWVFESVDADYWRLRNLKTKMYLYLNFDGRGEGGSPGTPIITHRDSESGNADWKLMFE